MSPSSAARAALSALYLFTNVLCANATEDLWHARRLAAVPDGSRWAAAAPGWNAALTPWPRPSSRTVSADLPAVSNDAFPLNRMRAALTSAPIRIERVDHPAASRAVLLLQDVHENAEAQRRLSDALLALAALRAVDRVGAEGAFAPFRTEPLRSLASVDVRRRVANVYRDQNRLGAVSYAALVADAPLQAGGIDDRAAYAANVRAYLRARSEQAGAERALRRLNARAAALASRLSPRAAALDRLFAARHAGTLDVGAYVAALAKGSVPPEAAIADFLEARRLEKAIPFDQADCERRETLRRLAERASAADLAGLVGDSLRLRSGEIAFSAFQSRFEALCRRAGVAPAGAAFAAYLRYAALSEKIDGDRLFAAIDRLERRRTEEAAITPFDRTFLQARADLRSLDELVRFALTSERWQRIQNRNLSLARVAGALTALDGERPETEPSLGAFADFYRWADRRSAAMADRISEGPAAQAVVVGGFHTEELARRLAARGLAVAVAAPRLSRADGDPSAYLSVFEREKTPLDRLFIGQPLFLAPRSAQIEWPSLGRGELPGDLRLAAAEAAGTRVDGPVPVDRTAGLWVESGPGNDGARFTVVETGLPAHPGARLLVENDRVQAAAARARRDAAVAVWIVWLLDRAGLDATARLYVRVAPEVETIVFGLLPTGLVSAAFLAVVPTPVRWAAFTVGVGLLLAFPLSHAMPAEAARRLGDRYGFVPGIGHAVGFSLVHTALVSVAAAAAAGIQPAGLDPIGGVAAPLGLLWAVVAVVHRKVDQGARIRAPALERLFAYLRDNEAAFPANVSVASTGQHLRFRFTTDVSGDFVPSVDVVPGDIEALIARARRGASFSQRAAYVFDRLPSSTAIAALAAALRQEIAFIELGNAQTILLFGAEGHVGLDPVTHAFAALGPNIVRRHFHLHPSYARVLLIDLHARHLADAVRRLVALVPSGDDLYSRYEGARNVIFNGRGDFLVLGADPRLPSVWNSTDEADESNGHAAVMERVITDRVLAFVIADVERTGGSDEERVARVRATIVDTFRQLGVYARYVTAEEAAAAGEDRALSAAQAAVQADIDTADWNATRSALRLLWPDRRSEQMDADRVAAGAWLATLPPAVSRDPLEEMRPAIGGTEATTRLTPEDEAALTAPDDSGVFGSSDLHPAVSDPDRLAAEESFQRSIRGLTDVYHRVQLRLGRDREWPVDAKHILVLGGGDLVTDFLILRDVLAQIAAKVYRQGRMPSVQIYQPNRKAARSMRKILARENLTDFTVLPNLPRTGSYDLVLWDAGPTDPADHSGEHLVERGRDEASLLNSLESFAQRLPGILSPYGIAVVSGVVHPNVARILAAGSGDSLGRLNVVSADSIDRTGRYGHSYFLSRRSSSDPVVVFPDAVRLEAALAVHPTIGTVFRLDRAMQLMNKTDRPITPSRSWILANQLQTIDLTAFGKRASGLEHWEDVVRHHPEQVTILTAPGGEIVGFQLGRVAGNRYIGLKVGVDRQRGMADGELRRGAGSFLYDVTFRELLRRGIHTFVFDVWDGVGITNNGSRQVIPEQSSAGFHNKYWSRRGLEREFKPGEVDAVVDLSALNFSETAGFDVPPTGDAGLRPGTWAVMFESLFLLFGWAPSRRTVVRIAGVTEGLITGALLSWSPLAGVAAWAALNVAFHLPGVYRWNADFADWELALPGDPDFFHHYTAAVFTAATSLIGLLPALLQAHPGFTVAASLLPHALLNFYLASKQTTAADLASLLPPELRERLAATAGRRVVDVVVSGLDRRALRRLHLERYRQSYVALYIQAPTTSLRPYVEYIVAVDRADHLAQRLDAIADGDLGLNELEFYFRFQVHPAAERIHLDMISIGRSNGKTLPGNGYGRAAMKSFVTWLEERFPGWPISAVAISQITDNWMEDFFSAHPASVEEAPAGLRIDPSQVRSFRMGTIGSRIPLRSVLLTMEEKRFLLSGAAAGMPDDVLGERLLAPLGIDIPNVELRGSIGYAVPELLLNAVQQDMRRNRVNAEEALWRTNVELRAGTPGRRLELFIANQGEIDYEEIRLAIPTLLKTLIDIHEAAVQGVNRKGESLTDLAARTTFRPERRELRLSQLRQTITTIRRFIGKPLNDASAASLLPLRFFSLREGFRQRYLKRAGAADARALPDHGNTGVALSVLAELSKRFGTRLQIRSGEGRTFVVFAVPGPYVTAAAAPHPRASRSGVWTLEEGPIDPPAPGSWAGLFTAMFAAAGWRPSASVVILVSALIESAVTAALAPAGLPGLAVWTVLNVAAHRAGVFGWDLSRGQWRLIRPGEDGFDRAFRRAMATAALSLPAFVPAAAGASWMAVVTAALVPHAASALLSIHAQATASPAEPALDAPWAAARLAAFDAARTADRARPAGAQSAVRRWLADTAADLAPARPLGLADQEDTAPSGDALAAIRAALRSETDPALREAAGNGFALAAAGIGYDAGAASAEKDRTPVDSFVWVGSPAEVTEAIDARGERGGTGRLVLVVPANEPAFLAALRRSLSADIERGSIILRADRYGSAFALAASLYPGAAPDTLASKLLASRRQRFYRRSAPPAGFMAPPAIWTDEANAAAWRRSFSLYLALGALRDAVPVSLDRLPEYERVRALLSGA